MSATLRFTVAGKPETKGSTKSFGFVVKNPTTGQPVMNRSGRPLIRTITTNDNPKAKSWQQLIAERAANALIDANLQPFADGAVVLDVWFYFPRPQKFLIAKWAHVDVPHTTKPDADKCLRVVKDALSQVVYRDDARVVDAYVHKRYCAAGEVPRAEITVRGVEWRLPKPIVHPETPTLFGEEALYGETAIR